MFGQIIDFRDGGRRYRKTVDVHRAVFRRPSRTTAAAWYAVLFLN